MSWRKVVGLAVLLVSCTDDGIDGPIDTMEECKTAGGRVVPGTGPTPTCDAGEEVIGSIPGSFEGIICCRAK
jgi:hypothetical protein